jgi:hypothetical protein
VNRDHPSFFKLTEFETLYIISWNNLERSRVI